MLDFDYPLSRTRRKVNEMKKSLGRLKVCQERSAGRTCLECGFLALDNNELSYTDRVLLHIHLGGTSMGLPNWQKIWCAKQLWVS